MRASFCIRFLGNLAASLGERVCLELSECLDVISLVERVVRSGGEPLSVEELLVTLPDGAPLPPGATTCDAGEVRVLRMLRGG